jgi:hypothetical protein
LWLANNTNTQQSTIALTLFIAKEGVGVIGAKAWPIRQSQENNNFHHKRDIDDSEHKQDWYVVSYDVLIFHEFNSKTHPHLTRQISK